MLTRNVRSYLPAVFMFLCSLPLGAQQVYTENAASQLGVLNLTTGAYTPIGTTSARIGGFASVGGTLFGLADNAELYQINTSTAALTAVGNLNTGLGGYGLGETSDSTVYAVLQSSQLYTMNTNTATPTLIGNLNFDTDCDPSGDAGGNLYDAQGVNGGGFYQIDRTTGAGTLLGTNNWGTVLAVADVQGIMYAINNTGSIYTVNLANGAATLEATYDVNAVGNVYAAGVPAPPGPSDVPEPCWPAFLSGLVVPGAILYRRRQAAKS